MSKSNDQPLRVSGIPDSVPESAAAVCRSRLLAAIQDLSPHVDTPELLVSIGNKAGFRAHGRSAPLRDDDSPQPNRYQSRPPFYTFDQLIVPGEVLDVLLAAAELPTIEDRVFGQWGLCTIEPFPRTALNFHGPPGTGKTLAAHALADRLKRPILVASYAEIESKYHGDGPKNVKAIFRAAEHDNAVLFIDEADSLLSKRLTSVTQGSEQAINSMRSQLLICLEQFRGVVIFATNLVQNYDRAFETRIRYVRFSMPDLESRRRIWDQHLVSTLPLAGDVNTAELAESFDDVCGRDIKNAVIDAAVRVATSGRDEVARDDLLSAVERIKAARIPSSSPRPLTAIEREETKAKLRAALRHDQTEGQTKRATPADTA